MIVMRGNKKEHFIHYQGLGTTAMKYFLKYLIEHKKGLNKTQRKTLLSKLEKSCTIEHIEDGSMRSRLLKGIEKIGQPDPQKYFEAYIRKFRKKIKRNIAIQ